MIPELDAMNKITNSIHTQLEKLQPAPRARVLRYLADWIAAHVVEESSAPNGKAPDLEQVSSS